ncbi:hypothetical protein LFT44_08640 [Arthrobacter sp. FW306-05-C]|uniref:hypothetical protein n=1 Tax=Arthrobacter sp. FW306-05-C TaxID=2879620 RepID=UPI001F237C38|nr:hypothetical protein [Arthrobacter sp. FW306-05-C]UKA68824.1 hypothetical protein LFT44_08640 [Arthrobacter sp. FW306-05-C]
MAVERFIADNGWVEALSPGDADILCICGEVPDDQADALERLWDQLPGPRSRTVVTGPEHAGRALNGCFEKLLDVDEQFRLEAERSASEPEQDDEGKGDGGMDHGDMSHEGMDHGDMSHEGMDHGDMSHEGMDHGDMEMPMPGGIGLAGEGRDRDGLDLDALKVPLGPYLPFWPAGLVLHCELQGDVVFAARAEYVFDQATETRVGGQLGTDRVALVRQSDLVSRLLALAGAAREAARVRGVRDAALDGAVLDECRRSLAAAGTRLRRDWLLRRTLQGVGRIPEGGGEPGEFGGTDAWDRLLAVLDGTAAGTATAVGVPLGVLPNLVRGLELSVVRLIVASLDLSPVPVPAADGMAR